MAPNNLYGNNNFHSATFLKGARITGNNSFDILTFTAGQVYELEGGSTQTINSGGVFNGNGSCVDFLTIVSTFPGSAAQIVKTEGTVTLNYAVLQDIHGIGGATFNAANSTDLGNNNGWAFHPAAPRNLYWVGGGGNWNDAAHWSLSSGDVGGECIPTPSDNVFFDQNSGFAQQNEQVNINVPAAFCQDMDWAGVLNTPILAGDPQNALFIFGSLRLIPDMVWSINGEVHFRAFEGGKTIFSAGKEFLYEVYFDGSGGQWALLDAFQARTIYHTAGALYTNGQDMTVATGFYSGGSPSRTLNFGSSNIYIGTTSSTFTSFYCYPEPLDFDAGTSTIYMRGSGVFYGSYYFEGGNHLYHNLICEVAPNNLYGNNNFHSATFLKGARITGNNSFQSLTFSPGSTYELAAGATQTIAPLGDFIAEGYGGFPIEIKSSNVGQQATLHKDGDPVCLDFLYLTDIAATGSAFTYAGANSDDVFNNSGWIFEACPDCFGAPPAPAPALDPASVLNVSVGQQATLILQNLPAGYEAVWFDADQATELYAGTANFFQPVVNENGIFYGAIRELATGCVSELLPVSVYVYFTVSKTATSIDAAGNGEIDHPNEVIEYTIILTNTGNQNLTNISATETFPGAGPGTLSPPVETGGNGVNGDGVLDIGEVWTYTATYAVTQEDIDANTALVNTISIDAEETEPVTATASTPVIYNPALSMDKAITAGAIYTQEGDVVFYSYTLANTGNVSLSEPVVYDDKIGYIGCASGPLAPGTSTTCTATYFINPGDVDNGSVTNVAYAYTYYFNGQYWQYVQSNTDSETATAEFVVNCPGDITLESCLAQAEVDGAFANWLASFVAYGACNPLIYYTVNGQMAYSLDDVAAPNSCGGAVMITVFAMNDCDGSTSCSSTFTVNGDDTPPLITQAMNLTVECDGNGNATALNNWLSTHGGASVVDNCQQVSWSDNFDGLSSLCGATGSATVTFTASDLCGLSSSTIATFTIEDTRPPSGACPQGLSGLTNPSQAPALDIALMESLYADLCGSVSAQYTSSVVNYLNACLDFEVRQTYVIRDECGNTTTCQVIHTGKVPTQITGECPVAGLNNLQCQGDVPPANLAYIASFFTGSDGQPVSAELSDVNYYSETGGDCGFFVVQQYTLTDNCGNTRVCEITYTVEDTTPPQGNCPSGYEVSSLDEVPAPNPDWVRGYYADNCSDVWVEFLYATESGGPCEGYTVTHHYVVGDNCGTDNTIQCTVAFTVPPINSGITGTCPPAVTGLQCWSDVPTPAEAQLVMEQAFPGASPTYLGTTTMNNYCQFTIRHLFSVEDPCAGRTVCTLT
ncbi:MAG: DUF11 domain-containing protein, partial [Phaeodactylibacter sp.]|nr:DUF11 domain-containing protein [Phaeodactylibacter sp.]